MKRAIIIGAKGQDGSYMKELLESKGYVVFGFGRELGINSLINEIPKYNPDEIYNFASSSNVFNAWENLDLVFDTDGRLPQLILEYILKNNKSIKYFQASSCLIFGRNEDGIQNENTPINPIHPYGIAKAYADMMVKELRKVHGIFACSGIFYNHESPRRGDSFFSKKVVKAAVKKQKIKVGNWYSKRDMGYAPEYMEAVYRMMQNYEPKDYVIGTGKLIEMRQFAENVFDQVGLDYREYMEVDDSLRRQNDTEFLRADITKIKNELCWKPKVGIDEMIKIMIDHERAI